MKHITEASPCPECSNPECIASPPQPVTSSLLPVASVVEVGQPVEGVAELIAELESLAFDLQHNGTINRKVDDSIDRAIAALVQGSRPELVAELSEKLASLYSGCYDLSREELIKRITAVGPEEWKAGNWLADHDSALRERVLTEAESRRTSSDEELREAARGALESAAREFMLAANSGIETVLNRLAADLLHRRAERLYPEPRAVAALTTPEGNKA